MSSAPPSTQPSQTTFGIAWENAAAPPRVIVSFAPWVLKESPFQLSVAVTAPLVTDSSSARAAAGASRTSAQAAASSVFIRQASRPAGRLSLGERPRTYGARHLVQELVHRGELLRSDDAVSERLGDKARREDRERVLRAQLLGVLGSQRDRVGGGAARGDPQLED